jgi:D-3-phosphoglycerate dehydrogenase
VTRTLLIAADVDRSLMDRAATDSRFAVVHHPVRTEEELAAIVGDVEILVTRAYNKVTRRVLEAAPRLELIAQGTSGIDNIDVEYARSRGIAIINLPGGNANAVAELVLGSMIALTRTVPFYTREVQAGRFERDDCATRHEMRFYRLGIVGLGQVGMRVARLARAFSMQVRAFDPYLSNGDFAERGAERAGSLEELLRGSDVLTLHVPLAAETRRMVGAAELAMLPRGAFLVSAARGEILDQAAAFAALESGHLAGMAMDVFDPEPPVGGFADDPRLILTPHVAGCTFECKSEIGATLYERILAFYAGR